MYLIFLEVQTPTNHRWFDYPSMISQKNQGYHDGGAGQLLPSRTEIWWCATGTEKNQPDTLQKWPNVFFLNRKVDHLRSFFFQKNILRRWYFSYISFFWPLHQPISASHEKKSWVVDLEDHTVIPSIRKAWWTLLILTRALCWSWWAMH